MSKGIPTVKEWNVKFEKGDTIVVHAPTKALAILNTRHGSCRFDPIRSVSINRNDEDARFLARFGAKYDKAAGGYRCAGLVFCRSKNRASAARELRNLPSLQYLQARGATFGGARVDQWAIDGGRILLGWNTPSAAHALRHRDFMALRDAIVKWDDTGREVFQCDTGDKLDAWRARERADLRAIGLAYQKAFSPNVRDSDVDLIHPDQNNGQLRKQLMMAGVHGCQFDPATRAQKGWGW